MPDSPDPAVAAALTTERESLEALVQSRGRHLFGYETAEDLLQGASLRILAAPPPDGREAGVLSAWMRRVVEAHLVDRTRYWKACRRDGAQLLRITTAQRETHAPGHVPQDRRTGPVTFAERRDELALAARALATLPPRDRRLVELQRDAVTLESVAEELQISPAAAQRARHRAVQRFESALGVLRAQGRSR